MAQAPHRLLAADRHSAVIDHQSPRQARGPCTARSRCCGAGHSQFTVRWPGPLRERQPAAAGLARPGPRRAAAGRISRPAAVCGELLAPEALDPVSHRSLDDWNTFYQAGTRLVRYLQFVGYNGLMMSALADGSAIYPSRLVEPTPRYDTGVFFVGWPGSGPQGRARTAVPAVRSRRSDAGAGSRIRFALGRARGDPAARADRRPRVSNGSAPTGAPGWPPTARIRVWPLTTTLLDPRVQQAMLRVVRELAMRYGSHESFGGISLQLSSEGYAQLPGDDWGLRRSDDRPLRTGDGNTSAGLRPRAVRRPRTLFDRRGARGVGRRGGPRRWPTFIVACGPRLPRRGKARNFTWPAARCWKADKRNTGYGPRCRDAPSWTKPWPNWASARKRIEATAASCCCGPQHLRPRSRPLAARAADLETNLAPEMDRLVANGRQTGSLFYHEPQKARLASFDAKSPFGAANTYTWLVSQMSPSGDRNRRRFVHSLATLDSQEMFDGGWMLPLGQEDALAEVVQRLSAVAGSTVRDRGRRSPAGDDSHAHTRPPDVYLLR